MIDAMKSMMPDFERSNGRSEPGGAEGSAAVGESPAGEGRARDAGVGPVFA